MESKESVIIINFMVGQLSTMKYSYEDIVKGCYEVAISKGYAEPVEGKDVIVSKVIDILNYY